MASDLIERMKKLAGNGGTKNPSRSLNERLKTIRSKKLDEHCGMPHSEDEEEEEEAVGDNEVVSRLPDEDVVAPQSSDDVVDDEFEDSEEVEGEVDCPVCHEVMDRIDFFDHVMKCHCDVMCGAANDEEEPEEVTLNMGPAANVPPENMPVTQEGAKEVAAIAAHVDSKLGKGKDNRISKPGKNAESEKPVTKVEGPKEVMKVCKDQDLDLKKVKVAESAANAEKNTNIFGDKPTEVVPNMVKPEGLEFPKGVADDLKKAIEEQKAQFDLLEDTDHASAAFHANNVFVMQKILDHLEKKDLMEFKKAQVYFSTLWSEIMHVFPDSVVKHLAGGCPTAKKLSDYFNVVKQEK